MTRAAATARGVAAIAALALAALMPGGDAAAHAAYASSEPSFGAVLERAPERISLTFSQELFRREGANAIEWAAADGGAAGEFSDAGEVSISNTDRRTMSVTLPAGDWGEGRFVVRWRNLSADDGDADDGEFPFYVGRSPTAEEEALDREMAVALLIVYPGDEPEEEAAEAAAAPAPRPVRLVEDAETEGLSAFAAAWLAVGIAAGVLVVGVSARRWRRVDG